MSIKVDDIVKQVLSELDAQNTVSTGPVRPAVPDFTGRETGRMAILESQENYVMKSYVLPEIGPKDILVKMEGCMISSADVTEFLKERRSSNSAIQGQEGTGVIVRVGSDGLRDARGRSLNVGDKVIMANKGGVSGSLTGGRRRDPASVNSWFASYRVISAGATTYQVNDLDLESRILISRAIQIEREVERIVKLCTLNGESAAVVIGCGLTGLMTIAALKCRGINRIIAIDNETEKNRSLEFGAWDFIGSHEKNGVGGICEKIKRICGDLADGVFICTDAPMGRTVARRFMKNSGSICDIGFLCGNRPVSAARYYDDCRPAGARFYSSADYEKGIAFLKNAAEKELPIYKLITHRYRLEEINEAMWTAVREEGLGIAVFNR